MEKSNLKEIVHGQTAVAVPPRTLEIRTLKFMDGDTPVTFFGVFGKDGKRSNNIWCATFYDHDEAQAWVIASKTFGRPVLGGPVQAQQTGESTDGTGKTSGAVSATADESDRRVSGKACGSGSSRGS